MGEDSARRRAPCFVVGVDSERSKAVFKLVQLLLRAKFAGVSSVLARRLCMRGEQGKDRLPSLPSRVLGVCNRDKTGERGGGRPIPGEGSICPADLPKAFPGLVLKSLLSPSFGDASQLQAVTKGLSVSWSFKGSSSSGMADERLSESPDFWRL